ncbi:MAG: 30S ribosome-binding factor RbfA [Deltaproteobacteria bacterium]|jgi:ribosome-binding factor A|nr:30S ribosome-binding factor RbfA [Deltaproteobacteria bacterium]
MKQRRREKMERVLKEFVATFFLTKVSDPRLQFLTVTRASVANDLKKADFYYTVLGDDVPGTLEKASQALGKAKGYVRAAIGAELELRYVPEINFIYDKNPAYAQEIWGRLQKQSGSPSQFPPPENSPDETLGETSGDDSEEETR